MLFNGTVSTAEIICREVIRENDLNGEYIKATVT
jgi:hypothetical protein